MHFSRLAVPSTRTTPPTFPEQALITPPSAGIAAQVIPPTNRLAAQLDAAANRLACRQFMMTPLPSLVERSLVGRGVPESGISRPSYPARRACAGVELVG